MRRPIENGNFIGFFFSSFARCFSAGEKNENENESRTIYINFHRFIPVNFLRANTALTLNQIPGENERSIWHEHDWLTIDAFCIRRPTCMHTKEICRHIKWNTHSLRVWMKSCCISSSLSPSLHKSYHSRPISLCYIRFHIWREEWALRVYCVSRRHYGAKVNISFFLNRFE